MRKRSKKLGVYLFLSIIFLSFTTHAKTTQSVQDSTILPAPKVDKRVELLSIIFRLAGSQEYSGEYNKSYVEDIHKYFDKYKNHPVVAFAKLMRDSNGVAYDAVMSLAVHISQPPELQPLVPFNDSIPERRWGADSAKKFIRLLQGFYKDAKCEEFFREEGVKYKQAEKAFRVVYNKLDLNWYKQYYGAVPDGEFNIVVGLGNGDGNYGPRVVYPNKKEEIYAIMGTWSVDSLGNPYYKIKDYFPILVHEFNHSFVNYLIYKNWALFEKAADTIYSRVTSEMRMQAYGDSKTMICEALVRASVIEYLKSHDTVGGNAAEKEAMEQLNSGFIWIKDLVSLLNIYEKNRAKYPTMESFIPEIATFYNHVAKNIDSIQNDYNKHCPHVVSIVQFENHSTTVDPSITEITIKFDRPLNKGYSMSYGEKGKEFFPEMKKIHYSEDHASLIIQTELKQDREYQFVLTGMAFKSLDGYSLQPYAIDFKTKK